MIINVVQSITQWNKIREKNLPYRNCLFSQQLSFKIPFSWSWYFLQCYLDMRAARHSVYCGASEIELLTHWMQPSTQYDVSSYSPPPLFSTAASFHRRKLNPLEGKSLLVGKGCSFAPMCRKQRECGAVWLSNVLHSKMTQHSQGVYMSSFKC